MTKTSETSCEASFKRKLGLLVFSRVLVLEVVYGYRYASICRVIGGRLTMEVAVFAEAVGCGFRFLDNIFFEWFWLGFGCMISRGARQRDS
jgi:hypothetical protein